MKFDGFAHRIEAELTFTGAELVDLFEITRSHYDAKCKAMAYPRHEHSHRTESDGLIFDQMCHFVSNHKLNEFPWGATSEELAEMCKANPELTIEVTLNWRQFDTLCKAMEMDAYRPEPNHDLSWGIRQAFNKVRGESRRLQEAEKQRRAEESS